MKVLVSGLLVACTHSVYIYIRILCLYIYYIYLYYRDTHIRQLKVFGPHISPLVMADTPLDSFKTVEMQQYATPR